MDVMMYALMGAVAGAAYRAASIYTEEEYPIHKLDPEPESFHMDVMARDLFARFMRIRKYNMQAYLNAFHATDSLLTLEDILNKKVAGKHDKKRAETYTRQAYRSARTLCKSYFKAKPELGVAEKRTIKDLYEDFEQLIFQHNVNITGLCDNPFVQAPRPY